MYPSQGHEIVLVYIIEEGGFVHGVACIGCGFLFWDHEFGNEEGIGDEGSAEDAAGFEVLCGVRGGHTQEIMPQVRVYEDSPQRSAGFGVGGGDESVILGLRVGSLGGGTRGRI